MLYIVVLTYIRPVEEVHAHLDTHRNWLVEYAKRGSIIVAGPLEDSSGGALLACCKDSAELNGMPAKDSFHVHRLVDYQVNAFTGALRADAFPPEWSPAAKAVKGLRSLGS
ncbi:YciI family protein [Bradyrhizobium sp.]|jgi:uncharacterized protein YciI|uniref:YciI family protein n=1 Tax=Bradyrhizobium sp. TaxID=376 RepID=UPI002DDD16E6|nr:YciI family protein [Bradyrhizobium sp.]HEV2160558.1 YciI family protein [Bradyrhizobium sp.]